MMALWVLVGAIVGAIAGASGAMLLGVAVGIAVAVVLAMVNAQRTESTELRQEIDRLRALLTARQIEARAPIRERVEAPQSPPPLDGAVVDPVPTRIPASQPLADPAPLIPPKRLDFPAAAPEVPQAPEPLRMPEPPRTVTPPTWRQAPAPQSMRASVRHDDGGLVDRVLGFFTGGNWPVKIGVLLLLFGVAALLKYAMDQGLLTLPLPLRLLAIATLGAFAVGVGYRTARAQRTFGLSVQGLGLGVIALVTYAAHARFGLIDLLPCYAVLGICVATAVGLALRQDALALAWLAAFGAYLAPWIGPVTSTPSGLLGYYLIVNGGVALLAWSRDWRTLNLLAFIATFFVGSVWGARYYRPEFAAAIEPWVWTHALLFIGIAWRFASRGDDDDLHRVEGSLIFGAPLALLLLLGLLFSNEPEALGARSALLGLLHLGFAAIVHWRGRLRTLRDCFIAIGIGALTLAVPLSFSTPTTAVVFALESLGLIWLGTRGDGGRFKRFAGALLFVLAPIAYVTGFDWRDDARLLLNGPAFGALALMLAGFGNAWLLDRAGARGWKLGAFAKLGRLVFFFAGASAWVIGAWLQSEHFYPSPERLWHLLLIAALGTLLGVGLHRGLRWPMARRLAELHFPLALLGLLAFVFESARPLTGARGIGWLLYAAVLVIALRTRATERSIGMFALRVGLPLLLLLVGAVDSFDRWNGLGWGDGVRVALFALPTLLLLAAFCWRDELLKPLYGSDDGESRWLATMLAVLAWLGVLIGATFAGNAAPFAFVPLFNPLELTLLAALVLGALKLRAFDQSPVLRAGTIGLGLISLSACALRWTHHLFDEPWSTELLASMRAQAALSMLWTLVGVGAMLFGARRSSRGAWRFGASLMGLVLLKLALIDRAFLSNLAGISAFLVVGVLLVLVGYFAPQPPEEKAR
jgi:uncharacterized membrane protein